MPYSKTELRLVAALIALSSVNAQANPVIVGLGAEGDDADSRSFSFFTDVGLTDATWVSASVARTDTDRGLFDLTTQYADLGIDHHFKPIGIRLGAAYWGDETLLESRDVRGSLYLRGGWGSVSVDVERRNFDLTLGAELLRDPIAVEFSADGIGLSASMPIGNRLHAYLGGMDYEYSRNIRLQPNVLDLRFFSRSRLSMINSLVDYRARIGVEVDFGSYRLDVRAARWQTEVDQGRIDSVGVGLLLPVGTAADAEFRLDYDDSEEFGGATVFSMFLYLFDD